MRNLLLTSLISTSFVTTALAGEPTQRFIQPNYVYTPPACNAQPFSDVPIDNFCPWIKKFAEDQITVGCGVGVFCPDANVTRKEMAVFFEKAMRGTDSWSPAMGVYKRVIVVSPTGFPLENGTNLLEGVASVPVGSDEYLIYVEPGNYNIGNASIEIPANADLVGAGPDLTVISGNGGASNTHGTITFAAKRRLADVTITSTSGTFATAIFTDQGAVLSNVEAWASGGTSNSTGIRVTAGQLEADNVFIDSTREGLRYESSNVLSRAERMRIEVNGGSSTYGILVSDGSLTIRNSRVQSSTNGGGQFVYGLNVSSATASVYDSELIANQGLNNVAAYVSSGVLNMHTTRVVASTFTAGAAVDYGIYVFGGGFLNMSGSRISVGTGGAATDRVGLKLLLDGQARVRTSQLDATRHGIYAGGTSAVRFDASEVTAPTNSVVSATTGAVLIGGSKLAGGVTSGTMKCVGSYDGDYDPLDSACQ